MLCGSRPVGQLSVWGALMTLTIENGLIPQLLREVILEGQCTVFIGSGLSSAIYGPWYGVVNQVCDGCGVACRVSSASSPEELLDAAQEAKSADPTAYLESLGRHFGRSAETLPSVYDALLSLPFASYLTVNLDPTLAIKAGRLTDPLRVYAYPTLDRRRMSKRSVHHLHGLISEGDVPKEGTIVLAREEFNEAYRDNSILMSLMVPTFANDPLVFVGCRLREPPMSRVFDICKKHQQERRRLIAESRQRRSEPPPRFILLPELNVIEADTRSGGERSETEMQSQEQYYAGLGVQPVWYKARGDDHSLLRRALEELAKLRPVVAGHGWEDGGHDG